MKIIEKLRDARRYSAEQLGEMLKVSADTIIRWETGNLKPTIQNLKDLALIFGVSVEDLQGIHPLNNSEKNKTANLKVAIPAAS